MYMYACTPHNACKIEALKLHSQLVISVHSQVGLTPLMKASFQGHVDIVRMLIEAKAQLNRQTEKVLTFYHN